MTRKEEEQFWSGVLITCKEEREYLEQRIAALQDKEADALRHITGNLMQPHAARKRRRR